MPDGILSPASSILSSQASREALQMALSTVGGLQTALEAANGLAQRSVTYGMEHARAAEHVNSEVAAPSRTCIHKPELAVILAASRLHPTSSTRFCTCASACQCPVIKLGRKYVLTDGKMTGNSRWGLNPGP